MSQEQLVRAIRTQTGHAAIPAFEIVHRRQQSNLADTLQLRPADHADVPSAAATSRFRLLQIAVVQGGRWIVCLSCTLTSLRSNGIGS